MKSEQDARVGRQKQDYLGQIFKCIPSTTGRSLATRSSTSDDTEHCLSIGEEVRKGSGKGKRRMKRRGRRKCETASRAAMKRVANDSNNLNQYHLYSSLMKQHRHASRRKQPLCRLSTNVILIILVALCTVRSSPKCYCLGQNATATSSTGDTGESEHESESSRIREKPADATDNSSSAYALSSPSPLSASLSNWTSYHFDYDKLLAKFGQDLSRREDIINLFKVVNDTRSNETIWRNIQELVEHDIGNGTNNQTANSSNGATTTNLSSSCPSASSPPIKQSTSAQNQTEIATTTAAAAATETTKVSSLGKTDNCTSERRSRKIVFEDTIFLKRPPKETEGHMTTSHRGESKSDPAIHWMILYNATTILVVKSANKYYYWTVSRTYQLVVVVVTQS